MARKGLRVAIVHDWLVGGGAERVVLELHRLYPEAPIFTSYATEEWRQRLDGKVVTGFLQRWPFGRLRKFVGLLRIWWFSRLDLHEYDIVIVSTGNGEAKAVRPRKDATYICYCHAPVHYFWRHYQVYLANPGFGAANPLARLGLRLLVGPLRRWDKKAAQRPNIFLANSTHTQAEIKTFYGRDAEVVFPPVDIERFQVQDPPTRKGFIAFGRQVPHKHTHLLVEACTKLALPLLVIGKGPEHERLKKMAGSTVQFIPYVTDEEAGRYMASAEAFLFASYDDFGVTPVEALAAGTPVIAYKMGGALDYVIPGKTGLFFNEQTAESLVGVLQEFNGNAFDNAEIAAFAKQFSPEVFQTHMQEVVSDATRK